MPGKRCPYWNEYESIEGWVCYCEIAAYGKRPTWEELLIIGCTEQKREQCRRDMERMMGMAAVPELTFEKQEVQAPALEGIEGLARSTA